MRVDQYKMPFQMKAGKNTVLLKLCQDEQEQRWTVEWQGQLRICDAAGTAILAKSRGATPEAGEATGGTEAEAAGAGRGERQSDNGTMLLSLWADGAAGTWNR